MIFTVLLLGSLLILGGPSAEGGSGSDIFQISETARAHQPGEVVLLTLSTAEDVDSVTVHGLSRAFQAHEVADGEWRALVGIDLNIEPGPHTLEIRSRSADGTVSNQNYPIQVRTKEFPTRRLTLDPKYVNPPQDQLERIRKERRILSAIFSSVTRNSYWEGAFQSPVPGLPNSGFGKRSILNGQPRSPHSGTDFDADAGTPVRNPNAGRVVLADDLFYTGLTVVVDHGLGLYSLFAHLSEFDVTAGQDLEQGETVGLVGATGRVTGPHLHWTVRLGTARVDPMSLIEVTSKPGSE